MEEKFIKDDNIIDMSQKEQEIDLIMRIINARNQLEIANKNFEKADLELVDYYTYEIKAKKMQLDYLIKKAKMSNISIENINLKKEKYS